MRIRIENYEVNNEVVLVEDRDAIMTLASGQARDFEISVNEELKIRRLKKGGEEPMAAKKKVPAKKAAKKKATKKKALPSMAPSGY
jgi:competence protein ComGC